MTVHEGPARAPWSFRGDHYRVTVDEVRLLARVTGSDDRPWFDLRLLAAADKTTGPDETLSIVDVRSRSETDELTVHIETTSSAWTTRWCEMHCAPAGLTIIGGVTGSGVLEGISLLGGRRPPGGYLPSGSAALSVFSPNPDHPRTVVRAASSSATIGVTGSGAEPGVGRWLFTPAPWCFALSRSAPGDVDINSAADAGWCFLGLTAPISAQTFTELRYEAEPEGFSLRLDYQGHTVVDGAFELPRIDIGFGADDPYVALGRHSAVIRGLGMAAGSAAPGERWWLEPLFCGWGAQSAIAGRRHTTPSSRMH